LVWANSAKLRIGIDILADRYVDSFREDIFSHNMIYAKSTERSIPIPDGLVDVVYSLNAIDHVNSLSAMCDEILRIMKKGGILYCSFNLEEPKSVTEPQVLTEEFIKEKLLDRMKIQSYRITNQVESDELFSPFYNNDLHYDKGAKGFLWMKAEKI